MKLKLLKGAFWVTLASLIVKVLSIVYKIPYQNLTGDKGFYIYQQMYPLYALVGALGSYAIPLALSEAIVNEKTKEKSIVSTLGIFILLSVVLSLFIVIFNPYLGRLMGDIKLSALFYPLLPALLIVPFLSTVRGYLYSDESSIGRVALSTTIEQLFRIIFITFILILYKYYYINNLYTVAKYSLLGYSIGLLMGTIIVVNKFNYHLVSYQYFNVKSGTKILKRSFFLLLSASLLLFIQLIDSLTIINSLTNKYNIEKVIIIKGVYDRGLPLIQTAIFFVQPLLSTFIPHLNDKENISRLLMFIIFLSLPATIGLIMVMEEVNILLFKDNQYTFVLQVNVVIVVVYSLILTLAAITKDNKRLTLIITVGLLIKYITNVILIKQFDILGASISSIISLAFILILLISINLNNLKIDYKTLGKIIISNGLMYLVLMIFKNIRILNNLPILILVGITSYLIFNYLMKTMSLKDLGEYK